MKNIEGVNMLVLLISTMIYIKPLNSVLIKYNVPCTDVWGKMG